MSTYSPASTPASFSSGSYSGSGPWFEGARIEWFASGLPLAPNKVRVVMQQVSGVFNTALDDSLLGGRNPCDGVRLPRVDAPPIFPMSIEQVDALLAATSEPFKAAIVIGAWPRLAPVGSGRPHLAFGVGVRPAVD